MLQAGVADACRRGQNLELGEAFQVGQICIVTLGTVRSTFTIPSSCRRIHFSAPFLDCLIAASRLLSPRCFASTVENRARGHQEKAEKQFIS